MNFTMFDPDRSTPWATNWGFKPELPLARAFSRQPLYGLMVFFLRKWLARIRLTDEFIGACRGDAIRTRKALEILKVRLADLVKADAFFLATAITSQQMEKEPATFASLELKLAIVAGRLESVSHRLSPSCSVADETSCGPVSVPDPFPSKVRHGRRRKQLPALEHLHTLPHGLPSAPLSGRSGAIPAPVPNAFDHRSYAHESTFLSGVDGELGLRPALM
jgi:hypothetical protein